MAFIETVARAEAQGPVGEMYDLVERRVGYLPNWVTAFSLRPEVWRAWDALNGAIRTNLTVREYELATLAAARALRSSYCALAHGRVLAEKVFDAPTVTAIATDPATAPVSEAERAMMAFAEQIVQGADRITKEDVDALRAHGYSDAAIFDIAATAAARCFFSKLLDSMGVQADAGYREFLSPPLREALTFGRPLAGPPASA
jgi:uncharacterized peroxidase-related enzyme